jgi:cytochrome c oxidase subunit III
MAERTIGYAVQFDSAEQQQEVATLGMWVFLATELMLFGVLFTGYTMYRLVYPETFAEASRHLNVMIGAINTGVLIVSSLMIALAVNAVKTGQLRAQVVYLVAAVALGTLFMGLKAVEYYQHYQEHLLPGISFDYPGAHPGQGQLFFLLYFLMTGLHALHLTIAIVIITIVLVSAARGSYSPAYSTPVELMGLYWHFVDIIWIFLLPLLYFPGLSG